MEQTEILARGALRLVDAGDGVRILEIDVPDRPINILTSSVLAELERTLDLIAADRSVKAVVVAGGKEGSKTFIAGADIEEIRAVTGEDRVRELALRGQEVISTLARIPQPVVAAIGGTCLGGGMELALACDFRVAADDPDIELGFPEVLLGIIPGFGGTQRLPRLVGIQAALGLILTGKRIDPRKAMKMGLVDRLAPRPILREEAVALAREAAAHGKSWRPKRNLRKGIVNWCLERTPIGHSIIRRSALREIQRKSGGQYPAPPRAVQAVIQGMKMSLEKGLLLEADLVAGLVAGEVAKNLMALFLAGEALRRGPRGAEAEARGEACCAVARAPRRMVIVGAGVMGGSIAALLARKGFRARLKDIRPEAISVAMAHAAKSFNDLVKRGRMSRAERENALSSISGTVEPAGLKGAEAVIEAVVEDLEVKRRVLREIEPSLGPGALFASNTSALSITALEEAAVRPERVVGLHFFNPVHRMPLVEVVQGKKSSEDALRAAEGLAREIGKYPLRVNDGPGFLVNRILSPYLNEAAYLLEEGVSIETIDKAMVEFGLPMGPFELLDEVGLDVAAKVGKILHQAFGDRAAPAPVLDRLSREGKLLGKKGGAGFYLYPPKGKKAPNPAVSPPVAPANGPPSPPGAIVQPQAIQEKLLYPMINEAARCLEEGIVALPREVDVASVYGFGFPPFRGGLLRYADKVGTRIIVEALNGFAGAAPTPAAAARFKPADLLARLAAAGRGFHDAPAK